MVYLITISCYGTHLRGDERGSYDHHRPAEPNPRRVAADRRRMAAPASSLDAGARASVLASLRETCAWRGWTLLAAHVRKEHVHAVVDAATKPEDLVRDLKAYASRRLNADGRGIERRWTRRASVRALTTAESIRAAVRYVADGQGAPMAVYVAPERSAVPAG